MTKLSVQLCGFFSVSGLNGKSYRPAGRKPTGVLAYLAYMQGKQVTRDKLIDLFWSDRGQKQGQDSLRQAIYAIRYALPSHSKNMVFSERNLVSLDPEFISYDLWRSDGSINENLEDRLLEDLDFISPVFDDWLALSRREVRDRQISRAERLLASLDPKSSPGESLQLTRIILKLDPTNEPAARTAIEIHADRDEVSHAMRIFETIRDRLQNDGLRISERTQKLIEQIARSRQYDTRRSKVDGLAMTLEPDRDVPVVEVALLSDRGHHISRLDLSEEFFDRIASRMVQMPELRVRVLSSSNEFSANAYSLRVIPSFRNDETRIVLRLSSGDGEAFWASSAPITLRSVDKHIEAQVDKAISQIKSAVEEYTYRTLNGPPQTAYQNYVVAERLFHAPPSDDYMEKVLHHLQQAVALDQDFLPAIERLVKFYNTGNFMSRPGTNHAKPRGKAYEFAQRLLFLNSRYPTAHVRMASCLLWQGKFQSAERSARRAMDLKPYDPYVLNVLGTALVYLGDLDAAEQYYGMAEDRLLHDMDFIRTDYGELFYLKENFEKALSWLESPEVRTPYRTLFWRAPTLGQLGRLVEARRDVEDMIEDLRKRWGGQQPFAPEAGIQWMCDMKPYRRTRHRDLLVDGFNKAGVQITASNFP